MSMFANNVMDYPVFLVQFTSGGNTFGFYIADVSGGYSYSSVTYSANESLSSATDANGLIEAVEAYLSGLSDWAGDGPVTDVTITKFTQASTVVT